MSECLCSSPYELINVKNYNEYVTKVIPNSKQYRLTRQKQVPVLAISGMDTVPRNMGRSNSNNWNC